MSEVVYFAFLDQMSLVKIGRSSLRRIERRIKEIQTCCPAPIDRWSYFDCVQHGIDEPSCHIRFSELRTHGEWFYDGDGEVTEFVMRKSGEWTEQDESLKSAREARFEKRLSTK